jgi:outer membrane lipoprotein-sorting protein
LLILGIALVATLASPAAAADTVALFRRGEQAERAARYSGVKLIWACGPGQTEKHADYQRSARIWHDGPGRTRLEMLGVDGTLARVVVENGAERWFYSPHHRLWRPVTWRPPEPRLDLLLRNYRLVRGPVEMIAGRRALQIRIEPRFPGSPRKQTWLDAATGITLRSDLYDRMGRLVSRSEFLQFVPERTLPASLFAVPVSSAEGNIRLHGPGSWAQETAGSPPLLALEPALPHYLPRGFVLDRVTRLHSAGSEVVRVIFTDGLNTLLLVEWEGPHEPEEGNRARFWSPGERHQWMLGPMHAMLAGDLPAAELERVAGSVRPPRLPSSSVVTRK